MTRQGDEYERFVQESLASKVMAAGPADLQTFRLKTYVGKSGQRHEIDVSFEVTFSGVKFLILVECKDYGRRVGVEDVMTFAYRLRDIGGHKGLLVTTRGFQSGAISVAKAEGLGLLIAAQGVLDVYMGAQYTTYEYWIDELVLRASTDSIEVCGRRRIAGNAMGDVRSIHESDKDGLRIETLAFLTPGEETLMSVEQSPRDPLRPNRQFGRPIRYGSTSAAVLIC